ncbi:M14 family metallopeptidase [Massilia sp. IC2-477]|uniref:succinylglutamate desuccinylase/aspartoacylase family protein n=1 Tax=Massilia sp. IC2-477 TaxID=2887198 RepID=UPI001D0FEEE6|nr:succinylglutamate desuccinylase/aspartoacylase family protein [Massilia sp. IC2-477]MCC2954739.1 M14 family metallopeptidase [Massilia sp. IC2-477]
MHIQTHPIASEPGLASYQLTSCHYGRPGSGRKAYIQASLHADEVPAMLVAQFVRRQLDRLEAEGRVQGEIVLVPAANPVGLSQLVQGTPFGRYDLGTGVNFNRAFRHVAEELKEKLAGRLGADAPANVALVRAGACAAVARWEPQDHTEALKKTLLSMAIDADIVLDLHCDNQGLLHVYAGTPLADQAAQLSALLGARALLLSNDSGGAPFDEACSRLWWELAEHFGPDTPIPPACAAVTVELRGEMDVRYDLTEQDAQALLQFLARESLLDIPLCELPAPQCDPTPLAGVEPLHAPQSGVLVFLKALGDRVAAGEAVADIVNPVSGATATLRAGQDGLLFASTAHRHLLRGMQVCKIAGATPFRSGSLLSQ